jgi:uncharacterized protein YjiS (DUF1127 family)
MPDDGFEIDGCEVRHLTLQQWTALRRSIIVRAREERKEAIDEVAARASRLCCALLAAASRISDALRSAWRRLRQHQKRLQELRELSQMDDLALRDLGISRLDIRAMRLNPNHAAPGRESDTQQEDF